MTSRFSGAQAIHIHRRFVLWQNTNALSDHYSVKTSTVIPHNCHSRVATQTDIKVTWHVREVLCCVCKCTFTEALCCKQLPLQNSVIKTILLVHSSSSRYLGYGVKDRKVVVRFPVIRRPRQRLTQWVTEALLRGWEAGRCEDFHSPQSMPRSQMCGAKPPFFHITSYYAP
jgi:hypothetical protein